VTSYALGRASARVRAGSDLSSRRFVAAALLVIAVALALAATWAVRAPLFLQPDERAHLDYAFGFFDAGRPFRTRPATPGIGLTAQEHYIDGQIGFRRLRYDPTARIRGDYGSPAFVAAFDAHAPRPSDRIPPPGSRLPYISFLYPALYYGLVASAMRLSDAATHSLWRDLLAARTVGVVLLGLTLGAAARVFRALRFSRGQTVLGLICVGWFPLTSWVAGYVQPDNLSFALVTVSLWLGLRWQRLQRPADALLLSVTLGLLFFTKQHYALCCWLAVLLMAAPRFVRMKPLRAAASVAFLIGIPALCFKASFLATYAPGLGLAASSFSKVGATMSPQHLRVLLGGYYDGITSAFLGGDSFNDYWLRFGERGETIFPSALAPAIRAGLAVVMPACFLLVAAAQVQIVRRIALVARRRSVLSGLRLATSSLCWNIYVLTALLLIFAFVQSNELIWLEGRYWLPLIVPMIALYARLANGFAPRLRPVVRFAFLGTLAGFCVVSGTSGIVAIDRAYYRAAPHPLRFVPISRVLDVRRSGFSVPEDETIGLHRSDELDVHGYAVDPHTGFAPRTVFAQVDGETLQHRASVGLSCEVIANAYSDDRLENGCFRLHLRGRDLTLGLHRLRLYAADPGFGALPLRSDLVLRVT